MKAKFLTTLFLLLTVMSFAKGQKIEHLNFKSVPIDGTLAEYVLKMKQNGFIHLKTEDGTAILKGDFAGYKECNLGVSTLKQKDLVHKIAVNFPKKETWSTLFGNYNDLKEMLTEKYGEPSEIVEKFDTRSEPRDDQSKMLFLYSDNCKYYSIWRTDKGDIELSIENNKSFLSKGFIKLAYLDKTNGNIIRQKAKDDL